ncbi:MAG TPA: penicillin acylase family protein, partial [Candidatus Limnocylindria bacterium]|nr:penicillin acylase family protein [Candidatus Limnocylindria bacterium]
MRLDGPSAPITIRRDRWGVPHLSAATDGDAWFGLGFCHGQDRAFQLEILLRAARGRLAEVLGPRAVPVDRLMRRLGVQRSAQAQLAVAAADVTAVLTAYVEGVNAAVRRGPRPHELVLLRARPTPWRASDVLAVAALQSLALSGNWDSELARLAILEADGPDALRAVDPAYGAWDGAAPTLGATPSDASPLAADMELLAGLVGVGVGIGASNNWALAPSRTRGGSALLANDPHLAPGVPGPWYLAHIETPEWSLSGASFVGAPSFPIGQNGFAAWGISAGLSDASDLFVVEPGPDGTSVRSGDELVECDVIDERIGVRGGPAVVERVVVTPWGPLISPVLEGVHRALAVRAVWLEPHPVRGLLGVARATSFAAFREAFADWPGPALNVAYADAAGHVAWQLVGR